MVVGRDRHDLRVGDRDLGLEGREFEVLLVLLRAVVATRQGEDHRVVPLQLAQGADGLGVIGERVVGEHASGHDVGAHLTHLRVGRERRSAGGRPCRRPVA